ncbi:MAG TPA: hypothetical protein VER11_22310, partial [Polyangiaceae bacterium]|nr:hypothetical protein [Polyangiaceae bacterium]
MLVRRLPTIALLAGLPLVLAHCSSDNPRDFGTAGAAPIAGAASVAGAPGTAGASTGTAGSAPIAGAGNATSSAGSSAGGASAGSTNGTAGSSGGGASGGTTGTAGSGGSSAGAAGKAGGGSGGSTGGSFTLTSPDLMEGAKFAKEYTCDAMNGTFGSGVNPELDWAGAPSGTMSYAITFIDTTLIGGSMPQLGRHWAIWNIPSTVMTFPKGTKTLSGDLANAKQSGSFLTPCAQSVMNGM